MASATEPESVVGAEAATAVRASAWGRNFDGEMGNGSSIDRPAPVLVTAAWGYDLFGQLGDGSNTDRTLPVQVQMPAGVHFKAVAAGTYHSLALSDTSGPWAWGDNITGELGDGSTTNSNVPVPVVTPEGVTFAALSAGGFHNLALDETGAAWAWGANGTGELGDGTTTQRTVPVAVDMPPGVTFTSVSAGGHHSLGLASDGAAWAWGYNHEGQIGGGSTTDRSSPVRVSMPAGVSFTAVWAGGRHSLALAGDGTAWAWGDNGSGQLGDSSHTNRTTPVRVHMPVGVRLTAVSSGLYHSLALSRDGSAWGWGDNFNGELGDGSMVGSDVPVRAQMPEGVSFSSITGGGYSSFSLTAGGRPWAWGGNGHGQLGDGTRMDRTVPIRVHLPPRVVVGVISGGFHALALVTGIARLS